MHVSRWILVKVLGIHEIKSLQKPSLLLMITKQMTVTYSVVWIDTILGNTLMASLSDVGDMECLEMDHTMPFIEDKTPYSTTFLA
jgi:hypothetical protein